MKIFLVLLLGPLTLLAPRDAYAYNLGCFALKNGHCYDDSLTCSPYHNDNEEWYGTTVAYLCDDLNAASNAANQYYTESTNCEAAFESLSNTHTSTAKTLDNCLGAFGWLADKCGPSGETIDACNAAYVRDQAALVTLNRRLLKAKKVCGSKCKKL